MNTGGGITLRQAAVRSLCDLAPLPIAALMVIPVFLLLVSAGDRLDPPISWTIGVLELEHSFGAMLLIISLLVWIVHWLAAGCVGIAMGTMVLKREDGRHAFDLLARAVVAGKSATKVEACQNPH